MSNPQPSPHPGLHPNLHRLAEQAVAGAIEHGLTVATAESFTAGMVAAVLADTPGASAMLQGGVVAYANSVKADVLGVSRELLDAAGSVDGQVAAAMASGARAALRCRRRRRHHRRGRPGAARRQGRGHGLHRPRHGGRRDVVRVPLRGQPPGDPGAGLRRRPGTAARSPVRRQATAGKVAGNKS